MKTLLTIAGFDPSSGAGITADLMVFAAHSHFGTSCITALTVQNTLGVEATHSVASDIVSATLDALYSDLPPSGIKIGMLATAGNVHSVATFLTRIQQQTRIPVVLDPVLKSSSGKDLLNPEGVEVLRRELLPLVDVVTPNLSELATLLRRETLARNDLSLAAAELKQLGANLTIIVTGGDLNPPDDFVFVSQSNETTLPGQHIDTRATHGTGCAFSSALLSRLVEGDDHLQAAKAAKAYVAQAMRSAAPLGSGRGPLNHLWPIR